MAKSTSMGQAIVLQPRKDQHITFDAPDKIDWKLYKAVTSPVPLDEFTGLVDFITDRFRRHQLPRRPRVGDIILVRLQPPDAEACYIASLMWPTKKGMELLHLSNLRGGGGGLISDISFICDPVVEGDSTSLVSCVIVEEDYSLLHNLFHAFNQPTDS